jgi:serine protease inhibitor
MLKNFCYIIQHSAKENIPRGKPRKYKPFWTQELNEQKNTRDRARQKAEKTKLKEDVAVWRKEKLILKHQITQSKRNAWNTFVSKLNYKTDGQK